ncbi:DUF2851 family protein [Croceitalea vernalis]|uniref:DUF2851 family protein n=1 Tax=Croceitalea vernalis TaxID=3075599 RepID=A0ABU3BL99_9FLAO|nr:DUF2851 family protein [Croceitalea sp. P007]MDT0622899.1 DUF2851 family protein [Croceitalea sp. P007]
MREDLLHFIWKTQKFTTNKLESSKGEQVQVLLPGNHNHKGGPDFFNSKIVINNQIWVGNVEIHLKSSDWYAHSHELDDKYDNVILHVVWEDDIAVFRKDKTEIPTLVLKSIVPDELLNSYQGLLNNSKRKFINCEKNFSEMDSFLLENWYHNLYFERLEQKTSLVFSLLEQTNNDWEKVLFTMLLKNFGLNLNSDSFYSLAQALDFSIVRKLQNNTLGLESVLFGMSGLLDKPELTDTYYLELKKEFNYQSIKFELRTKHVQSPEMFGLRPHNFPTIRLSQIANLYSLNHNLFDDLINSNSVTRMESILKVSASDYWKSHFTFGKESKVSSKTMTKNLIDLLIINTVIPLKFCYAKKHGKEINDELIGLISTLKPESNFIITGFDKIGEKTFNALESQSKIQLYNCYCTKNECLKCFIGVKLLNRNT